MIILNRTQNQISSSQLALLQILYGGKKFKMFFCKINIRGDLFVFIVVMLGFKKGYVSVLGVTIVLKSRAVG